jgi:prevent-host-death family protein
MSEKRVGVRELKANLSACLRRIKSGKTLVITERGKPIGRLSPVEATLDDHLKEGVRRQLWAWNGKKWKPSLPSVKNKGAKMISDLLLEDRD